MPYASSNGVRLYYEEAGKGMPIVFVHEFSGDLRSWEAQMRHFSRRYRCIAFNARGYPPSEVPASPSQYSMGSPPTTSPRVMRHLGIAKAHIIGCSMGAYATLQFGLRYPRMARCLSPRSARARAPIPRSARNSSSTSRRPERLFRERGPAGRRRVVPHAPHRIQLAEQGPARRSGNSGRISSSTRRSATH